MIQQVKDNDTLREKLKLENEDNIIEEFQNKILDTDKQYMFLVRHNKVNRVVNDEPEVPTLYHVGTFIEGKLSMEENIPVPFPKRHNFETIECVHNFFDNMDIFKLQGIIAFTPDI